MQVLEKEILTSFKHIKVSGKTNCTILFMETDKGPIKQENVTLSYVKAISYWLTTSQNEAYIYDDKKTLFKDELIRFTQREDDLIDPKNIPQTAIRLMTEVMDLVRGGDPNARPARSALKGRTETTEILLENTKLSPEIQNSIRSIAHFSRAVGLGVFSRKGLSVVYHGAKGFLATNGDRLGQDIPYGEVLEAQDHFNAGLVLLARAVAQRINKNK